MPQQMQQRQLASPTQEPWPHAHARANLRAVAPVRCCRATAPPACRRGPGSQSRVIGTALRAQRPWRLRGGGPIRRKQATPLGPAPAQSWHARWQRCMPPARLPSELKTSETSSRMPTARSHRQRPMNRTRSLAVRTVAPRNGAAQAHAAPVRRGGFGGGDQARRSGNRSGRWRRSASGRRRAPHRQTPAPWQAAQHPCSRRHRHCIWTLTCRLRDGGQPTPQSHWHRHGGDAGRRLLPQQSTLMRVHQPPFDGGPRHSPTWWRQRTPAAAGPAAATTSALDEIESTCNQFRRCRATLRQAQRRAATAASSRPVSVDSNVWLPEASSISSSVTKRP